MEIYCAVLERDCEPHYFDSKEKAFNYIWNQFHYENGNSLDEEDIQMLYNNLMFNPDNDGYYEIDDFGYYSQIVIE